MQNGNDEHDRQPARKHGQRWLVGLAVLAALPLAGCGSAPSAGATATKSEPAKVEKVAGSDISRLRLSERAVQRLDIKTTPVAAGARLTVPYGAVLYDASGATWTYTNPEPLVYVRHGITIERIDGDTAFLTAGPAAGTPVVTVGATELFGTEFKVSK